MKLGYLAIPLRGPGEALNKERRRYANDDEAGDPYL